MSQSDFQGGVTSQTQIRVELSRFQPLRLAALNRGAKTWLRTELLYCIPLIYQNLLFFRSAWMLWLSKLYLNFALSSLEIQENLEMQRTACFHVEIHHSAQKRSTPNKKRNNKICSCII